MEPPAGAYDSRNGLSVRRRALETIDERTSAGSRIGCSFDLRRGSGKNCTLELAGEEKKSMSV